MPNINVLKESKFLKKEDCGPSGALVTIRDCAQENVAKEGAPEELKWCLHFEETDKPLVLNSTNAQLIAAITGKPETEDWAGVKIVIYNDPSVSYAGKITGGIRVRAPRGQAAQPSTVKHPAPVKLPPAPEPDPNETPF